MNPERFRQIRNLFEAALERLPEQRIAFVDQAVKGDEGLQQEVRRMLDAHQQTVTFLDGVLAAPPALRTDPLRMEGRRLGPFEILREIGRGGMGTVYLARRADELFAQQVAIKVVTPESAGPEVIQRFLQEREILASLEHPNIGRLYDGGSTEEGWPYFVMEYVDGKPIDAWCDERKLNVTERLRLFQGICAAVHYAHQRRVVHRDLKPGNILVSADGAVKLLDFGIAKLVRSEPNGRVPMTRDGMHLMTPEYAGPEQIRAEGITPQTDIYSLGVILYELLTGRQPYRLKSRIFHEILRVICEEPPQRPSTAVIRYDDRPTQDGKTMRIAPGVLSQTREATPVELKRRLAGDLDHILLKALEKDPGRRYHSAEEFRMDLDRHLRAEPLLSGENAWWTSVGRLLGRHKVPIALGAGLFIAVVTGGIRIQWSGFASLVAVVILLALWHVATDQRTGPRIAAVVSWPLMIIALAGLGVMIVLFQKSRLEGPSLWMFDFVMVSALLFYSTRFAGFCFRKRWAGELLLRVGLSPFQKRMVAMAVVLGVLTVYTRVADMLHKGAPGGPQLLYACTLILVNFIQMFLFAGLEIRERGLFYRGRLFPWVQIRDHTWKPAPHTLFADNTEWVILRLEVHRLVHIFPFPRIAVPIGYQAEVDALMKRHLSMWPD
jgi:serine/threonine protein kinase